MTDQLSRTVATTANAAAPSMTAVVCTYTDRRWDMLVESVASLLAQTQCPDQTVVVVDHNDSLLARARVELGPDVEVVPNEEQAGLAGARNSGLRRARGEVVAFLDDDAHADAGWLAAMAAQYADPRVAGVGGAARPSWPGGQRPWWFPAEFDWVVGCTHRGLPEVVAPVRNPVGASMSIRRRLFDEVGGFDTAMGRIGTVPVGCEETEFAIRVRQRMPGVEFVHVPGAVAHHHVAEERARMRYFLRRCYAEGLSKAAVTQRAGADAALAEERRYTLVVLPRAVARESAAVVSGDVGGAVRAVVIVVGVMATVGGYVVGQSRLVAHRVRGSLRGSRHG